MPEDSKGWTQVPGNIDRAQYRSIWLRIVSGDLVGRTNNDGQMWLAPESVTRLTKENDAGCQRAWRAHDRVNELMGKAGFGSKVPGEIAEKRRNAVIARSAAMTVAAVGGRISEAHECSPETAKRLRGLMGAAEFEGYAGEDAEEQRRTVLALARETNR